MKNIERNVVMLCSVCGNDRFKSLDVECEDFLHVNEIGRVRCSNCGTEYTKQDIIDSNEEIINSTIDEVKRESIKELEKEIKRLFRDGNQNETI